MGVEDTKRPQTQKGCGVVQGKETQVFAHGEDTRTLRLTSKLADLRVGYANWILLAERVKPSSKRE